jgi:hypothetical protein
MTGLYAVQIIHSAAPYSLFSEEKDLTMHLLHPERHQPLTGATCARDFKFLPQDMHAD